MLNDSLSQIEDDFLGIFDGLDDFLIIFDSDKSKILYTNKAVSEQLGIKENHISEMTIHNFFPFEYKEEVDKFLNLVIDNAKGEINLPFKKDNGETIFFNIKASICEFKGCKSILFVCRSIVELNQNEIKLRKKEENHKTIVLDLEISNKELEGLMNERAILAEEFYLISMKLRKSEDNYKTLVQDLEITNMELEGLMNERVIIAEEFQIMNIELKKLKNELIESNKKLREFAYVASHDLYEPLRTITSYITLVERRYNDKFDEKGKKYLGYIVEGAKRMLNLIEGLLIYSRVGTEGKDFKIVDCNKILENVQFNLQVALKESKAIVECVELPQIKGDPIQFEQLFQNLISNAIKFIKGKTPKIQISVLEQDKKDWIFSVKDNGIGIDSKNFDKIFDIFKRLHSRSEYSGTGIGLSVCKKIVERHGGRIWVESVLGEGTTFNFTIPIIEKKESIVK